MTKFKDYTREERAAYFKQKQKEYVERKIKEIGKEAFLEHRAKVAQAWRDKNPERYKEYQRKYHRKWCKDNPDKVNQYNRNWLLRKEEEEERDGHTKRD